MAVCRQSNSSGYIAADEARCQTQTRAHIRTARRAGGQGSDYWGLSDSSMDLIYVTLQMEGISAVCWHSMAVCGAPRATGTPAKPGIHTHWIRKWIPSGFALEVSVCACVCVCPNRMPHSCTMSVYDWNHMLVWGFLSAMKYLTVVLYVKMLSHMRMHHCTCCRIFLPQNCERAFELRAPCLCSLATGSGGTAIRCCCICSWCQLPVFPSGQANVLPAS